MTDATHPAADPSVSAGLVFADRADMIVGASAILAAALRARRPDADANSIARAKKLATWLVVAAHAAGGDDEAAKILAGPTNALRDAKPGRNFAGELLAELAKCAGGAVARNEKPDPAAIWEDPPSVVDGATFADLLAHVPEDQRAARMMETLRTIAAGGKESE